MKENNSSSRKIGIFWDVLPSDISQRILAQTSVLHYKILSLTSKAFGEQLRDPQLYNLRDSLGHKELQLHVLMRISESNSWYCMAAAGERVGLRPNFTSCSSSCSSYAAAAVGSKVFTLGGLGKSAMLDYVDLQTRETGKSCKMGSSVSRDTNRPLNAYREIWTETETIHLSAVGEKVYVIGANECGLQEYSLSRKSWKTIQKPLALKKQDESDLMVVWFGADVSNLVILLYDVIEDKPEKLIYKPTNGSWIRETSPLKPCPLAGSYTDILLLEGKILVRVAGSFLMWYDDKTAEWKDVRGCGLLKWSPLRIMDCGGDLAYLAKKEEKLFLCQVNLEMREDEIYGCEKDSQLIFSSDKPFDVLAALFLLH